MSHFRTPTRRWSTPATVVKLRPTATSPTATVRVVFYSDTGHYIGSARLNRAGLSASTERIALSTNAASWAVLG